MQHSELIELLGGNAALAAALNRDETSVCRWKTRGIPASLWPTIASLARTRRIRITADDLAAAHPTFGAGAAAPGPHRNNGDVHAKTRPQRRRQSRRRARPQHAAE